jgi:transcriptional regulator with XRE-family HTH domain
MGQSSRPRPARLAEKLVRIRTALGLTQTEFLEELEVLSEITQGMLSAYERDVREPPLLFLLIVSRKCLGGGEYLQNLADDEMELPRVLRPGTGKKKR